MSTIDLRGHRVLDLSQPIEPGMWDYRPLGVPVPPVEVKKIASYDADGYNLSQFLLNGLTGSYIESPHHMNPAARTLDKFDVRTMIRPARIMRLPPAEPYRLYTVDDLHAADPGLQHGEALVMVTGWDKARKQVPDYITAGPALAASTLQWFLDQPLSMWATDLTVADCLWGKEHGHPEEDGTDLLGDLYKARPDMLLLAPLCGLTDIRSEVGTIVALGPNIPGTCAVPARVLFIEGAVLQV